MAHFFSKDTTYENLYFVKCLFFNFKQSTFKPPTTSVFKEFDCTWSKNDTYR